MFFVVWIVSFLIQAFLYGYISTHSPKFPKWVTVIALNLITNLITFNVFGMYSLFFALDMFRKTKPTEAVNPAA